MEASWFYQLILLGALQGLILAAVVWKKKNSNKIASSLLVILLVLTSLVLVGRVFYQAAILKRFWIVYTYTDIIIFLFGPVLYFFTYSLLKKKFLSRDKYKWHLLPAAIHLLVVNTIISLTIIGVITFINGPLLLLIYYGLEFFAIVSLAIYSWKSIGLFFQYEFEYYDSFSYPILASFLKSFLYFFFLLSLLWLAAFTLKVSGILSGQEITGYYGVWTFASVSTYLLSYKVLLNPDVLNLDIGQIDLQEKLPEKPIRVSDAIDQTSKNRLETLMEDTQIYLNPKLSLEELANAMQISRHELSKLINQGFGKTFFDLINGYRIKAFIKSFQNGKNLTFLEVAYEVGFNSKSAFNRAFRKETGASPSEYFKNELAAKKSSR